MEKDIKHYEGIYTIDINGNVLLIKKKRYLSQSINTGGYKNVVLRKDGKQKQFLVHRLLADAFIEKIEGRRFVDHIDGNRLNNNISNLRWATSQQNNFNKKVQKNNRLGIKCIRYINDDNYEGFRVEVKLDGKTYSKNFNCKDPMALEKAIDHRNILTKELHGEFAR